MARGFGGGGGVGRLFKEVIISNISIIGGNYLRDAINRGMAIIRGNTRYPFPCVQKILFPPLNGYNSLT